MMERQMIEDLEITVRAMGQEESPRDYENLGTFYTAHRRYSSPDKPSVSGRNDGLALWKSVAKDLWMFEKGGAFEGETPSGIEMYKEQIDEVVAELDRNAVWSEVYLYDHSGTAYRASKNGNPFSCPWDSGMVGLVFCRNDKALTMLGETVMTDSLRERVLKEMGEEVRVYSAWANGELYEWTVTDPDGDVIAGSSGHTDPEEAMTEAVDAARSEIANRDEGPGLA